MPERAWEWARRIHFGPGRTVALDFGAEPWKRDVSLYESADGILAALSRTEGPLDDGLILSHAVGSLLDDVVDAAGGVEIAHARLHQAMALVQETVMRWSSTLGEMSAWIHRSANAVAGFVIWPGARRVDARVVVMASRRRWRVGVGCWSLSGWVVLPTP